MKKLFALLLAAMMIVSLAACNNSASEQSQAPDPGQSNGAQNTAAPGGSSDPITLTLWGAEEDQDLLAQLVEEFKAEYSDYTFDIQIGVQSESTAKDTILTDVEAGADVYAFASDQLTDLVAAGALLALDDTMDQVLQSYTGKTLDEIMSANSAGSVEVSTYEDTLYAFPFSADGYFMFYDPTYISAEQAQSWDTLLDAAEAAGKRVGMTLASGWYNAGFFYGAGFTTTLNADGTTVIDWNGTSADGITGVQVTQGMLGIASHPAFLAIADGDVSNQINSGSLAAVISGCWDSSTAEANFGDDYVACKLPTFTCGDQQVQTGSVASYKLMGVNPYAENTGWAMLLAEFLTNEQSQVTRFEQRALAPTNANASSDPSVAANKGVAGLAEQSAYAVVQTVGQRFWDPTASFGEQIAQGTIASDDASVQAALDSLVEGVNSAIE